MPTIFDGFDRASDQDIINQIVILKSMSFTNLAIVQGQKTAQTLTKITNSITNLFTDKLQITEPNAITIEESMIKEQLKLKDYSRGELDTLLRDTLHQKLSKNISKYPSDDELSVAVIDEAAKAFNIDENLISVQKADIIQARFTERMFSAIQKKMNTQTFTEKKQTEENIERSLQTLSTTEQNKIKELLKVETLTGETIYKALSTVGASTLTLSILGQVGGYMFLTTIMHGLFTTLLGITLPFAAYTTASSALSILTGPIGFLGVFGFSAYQIAKGAHKINSELLAQNVAFAVSLYGRMTPRKETLPSYIAYTKNPIEETETQQEINDLINKLNSISKKYTQTQSELTAIRNNLQKKENILAQIKSQQQERLQELQQKNITIKEYKEKIQNIEQDGIEFIKKLTKEKARYEQIIYELKTNVEKAKRENNTQTQTELLRLQQSYENAILDKNEEIIKYKTKLDEVDKANDEILKDLAQKEIYYVDLIKKLQKEVDCLSTENLNISQEATHTKNLLNRKEEKKAIVLGELWAIHFPKFKYMNKKQFLKEVVRHDLDTRLALEGVLKVLHESKDPKAESRSTMNNGDLHCAVSIAYRLSYTVDKQNIVTLKYFHHHKEQDKKY